MLMSSPTTSFPRLRSAAEARTPGSIDLVARHRRSRTLSAFAPRASSGGVVEPGDLVLVAGATGGVGQLVTAKLLERGYRVRAMTRNKASAARVFAGNAASLPAGLELVEADARDPRSLEAAFSPTSSDPSSAPRAVACCTGTTAFPSKRWQGDNGPKQTDEIGVRNLVEAARKASGSSPEPNPDGRIRRFVLVSSAGVERSDRVPYSILNLFGVLSSKRAGEQALRSSGLPLTILRPGRLIDGPYTSYDLNTLLKATTDESRKGVRVAAGDVLDGQTSRLAVAEAVVQSMGLPCTQGKELCLETTEGQGPGRDRGKWEALLCE